MKNIEMRRMQTEDVIWVIKFRNLHRKCNEWKHINSNRKLDRSDQEKMIKNIESGEIYIIAIFEEEIVWILLSKRWKHKFNHRVEAWIVVHPMHIWKWIGSSLLKEFERTCIWSWIIRIDFIVSQENVWSQKFALNNWYDKEWEELFGIQTHDGYATTIRYWKILNEEVV